MMSAIGEILIFLDDLSTVPDVYFNDAKIFFWILLDNFSAVPDVSAEGYDVIAALGCVHLLIVLSQVTQ